MNKKNKFIWTEKHLYDYKILSDKEAVKDMIRNYTDSGDLIGLYVDSYYPLTKDLAGISIEIGEFIIKKINIDYILNLLNSCGADAEFNVVQDFDAVKEWAIISNVEQPDLDLCEGYIFNNELINFYKEDNIMVLQFKYKDQAQSSFILFKLSFFRTRSSYFVFQCRYF